MWAYHHGEAKALDFIELADAAPGSGRDPQDLQ